MADGARFDINIEANALGVDSSAAQLNSLVERMTKANTVATQFDNVVAAARARLEEASAAAAAAANALGAAEGRYKELESAANRAAKEVEKAAAAGKDTTALQTAAEAAKAAMSAQANVVDELREKSVAAANAQKQLAGTLKTLEGQQSQAAAAYRKAQPAAKSFAEEANKVDAAGKAKEAGKLGQSMVSLRGMTMATAAGFALFAGAALAGVVSLAKFGFGVQSNAANMQRLAMAQQRMQLGMQKLFKGLQWDKFTRGLEDVMSLFDEGTSSANGMKLLVETILQPLIDGAAKAAPYVKEMFKGLIYGALQVVIAVLRIRNEIFKAMSPETRAYIKRLSDKIFTLENAFKAGAAIAVVLAAAFVALTVSLISMGVAELFALWPILLIVAAIALVIAAIMNWDKIVKAISETWDAFVTGAKAAAKNMIDGIVNGIKNGVGFVVDAMKNLASRGVQAFKDALGIKSPSKVFELQARYTAEGYVQGIESSTPEVTSALESMAAPPELAGAPVPATASTSTSSSTKSVTIQSLTVGAGEVSQANWAQFRQMLVELLGDAGNLTIGGGEAPAT